ncbi:MAG TPA: VOC family protein [Acidobacteriaceae bacterium]|jgi:predicted enzyme related to lactoylglutathione lyase|nr:VOC family protein [Acidobacteriaceae bacterium]
MAKATGVGGVFLRARDPQALYAWYEKHLGLPMSPGGIMIPAEQHRAVVVVAFFPKGSAYFPVEQPTMVNFQVDDLDALLDQLEADGVTVDPKRDSTEYGKFGWITDPEGNRVELYQPPDEGAA